MKQQRILDMLGHIDERYILEAAPAARARQARSPSKAGRTLLVAAVIVSLFAALCAVAYATGWFGLAQRITEPEEPTSVSLIIGEKTPVEGYISMNGIAGSPEAQAHAEWVAFRNEYVAQHSFSNDADLSWLGGDELMESYYMIYGAYDQAMLDKLRLLLEKEGISL